MIKTAKLLYFSDHIGYMLDIQMVRRRKINETKKNRFSVQSEPKVMKPNDFF